MNTVTRLRRLSSCSVNAFYSPFTSHFSFAQVYKLLWSERCGATWPCMEHIGHQCMPELNYLEHGKWRHSVCKVSTHSCASAAARNMTQSKPVQDGEICKVFPLSPSGVTGDWRMLMVNVPAGRKLMSHLLAYAEYRACILPLRSKNNHYIRSDMFAFVSCNRKCCGR